MFPLIIWSGICLIVLVVVILQLRRLLPRLSKLMDEDKAALTPEELEQLEEDRRRRMWDIDGTHGIYHNFDSDNTTVLLIVITGWFLLGVVAVIIPVALLLHDYFIPFMHQLVYSAH